MNSDHRHLQIGWNSRLKNYSKGETRNSQLWKNYKSCKSATNKSNHRQDSDGSKFRTMTKLYPVEPWARETLFLGHWISNPINPLRNSLISLILVILSWIKMDNMRSSQWMKNLRSWVMRLVNYRKVFMIVGNLIPMCMGMIMECQTIKLSWQPNTWKRQPNNLKWSKKERISMQSRIRKGQMRCGWGSWRIKDWTKIISSSGPDEDFYMN